VALLHANIGDAQFALRQLADSLASHTRALEILGKTVAEDHAELAFPQRRPAAQPLKGLALVWLATGEAGSALAALERALRIASDSNAVELAEIRFGLARALIAVHVVRARDLAHTALRSFEAAGVERSARCLSWAQSAAACWPRHDLALNGLQQQNKNDLSCLRRLAVKYACLMYPTPDAPGVLPRPEIRIRGGFAASDL